MRQQKCFLIRNGVMNVKKLIRISFWSFRKCSDCLTGLDIKDEKTTTLYKHSSQTAMHTKPFYRMKVKLFFFYSQRKHVSTIKIWSFVLHSSPVIDETGGSLCQWELMSWASLAYVILIVRKLRQREKEKQGEKETEEHTPQDILPPPPLIQTKEEDSTFTSPFQNIPQPLHPQPNLFSLIPPFLFPSFSSPLNLPLPPFTHQKHPPHPNPQPPLSTLDLTSSL